METCINQEPPRTRPRSRSLDVCFFFILPLLLSLCSLLFSRPSNRHKFSLLSRQRTVIYPRFSFSPAFVRFERPSFGYLPLVALGDVNYELDIRGILLWKCELGRHGAEELIPSVFFSGFMAVRWRRRLRETIYRAISAARGSTRRNKCIVPVNVISSGYRDGALTK